MNSYKLAALCLLAGIAGCSGTQTDSGDVSPQSSTPAATPVVNVSAEAMAQLEKADALDGTTDHVIGKCYTCALGMDGDKANSVKIGDYTAHFCSEACSEHFVGNAEEVVNTTEIPESAEH